MAVQIITPDQIANMQATSSYRLRVDGIDFDFQTSRQKHSVSYLGDETLRFELRDGDQFWWDKSSGFASERSQIGSKTLFANKVPVEVSFGLNIEPGATNTAKWLVLGQLHVAEQTGNLVNPSPPVELSLLGEKMRMTIRYTEADGKLASKVIFTDVNDIQRGKDYKFDIKTVFDPDGNGRVVLSRDGVVLADYSGPVGYQGQTKAFWAEGLYRDGAATETLSAQFSHLSIMSGNSVAMPTKDVFIDAPKLKVDHVSAVGKDGLRDVELSGSAKAGTIVTVSMGATKLGTAKVDAYGKFSLSVKIDSRSEISISAIATDLAGRDGIQSPKSYFQFGTGVEIGANLKTMMEKGNVESIVITDGTVITAPAATMFYTLKYGQALLQKIQGVCSFYDSVPVAGKTYDRLDTYYDASGAITKFVRFTKGSETYREINNADGSKHIIDKATPGQTTILDITKGGLTTRSEQYNAAGVLVVLNLKNETGASEQHIYNGATGFETKYVLKAADGSRVEGNLGLTGRSFTTEIYSFDKNGTMIRQERYEADGTKIFLQIWKPDGTKEVHNYDGVTGKETSFTVYAANGSRVETTLKPGQPDQILKTISYDAAGKVIGQTTGGTVPSTQDAAHGPTAPNAAATPAETAAATPAKPVEAPVVTAPSPAPVVQTPTVQTVYAIDAKTKLKTGYTQTASDGTKTVVSFKPGQEDNLLKKDAFFANGKIALSETYDGAGNKTWSAVYKADGSHVNTQYGIKTGAYDTLQNVYNASEKIVASTTWKGGKVVASTTVDPDGSKMVKTYAANGTSTLVDRDANGKLLLSETYDGAGNKTWSAVYKADGSHVNTQYGIKTGAYDTLQNVYNASEKIVASTTWKGASLVSESKTAANGSTESTTYDAAGRKLSSTMTAADKSKDVFAFAYAGQSKVASTTQQDHYDATKKLWTDVTDASGNHKQTSYAVGVKLDSHAGVTDVFTSGGKDTFVFGKGDGKDVITNFTTSAAAHDTILFDHAGVHDFAGLHFTASGHDTVITFGTADSITLQNVAPSQMKPDFFLFV